MNVIKRWMERRRNRRESEKINERCLQEQRADIIKGHVKKVSDALEAIGFKTPSVFSTDMPATNATLTAVGPDNRVYRLTVYKSGGYRLDHEN